MKSNKEFLLAIGLMLCLLVLCPANVEALAYTAADLITVEDPSGDELSTEDIIRVSYVGDQTNQTLYLEVERNRTVFKSDWDFYIKTTSTNRSTNIYVFFNGKNRSVSVTVRDASTNAYIWSTSGKWSDDNGKSVRFSIPYRYIVGSTTPGYEFSFYAIGGKDRAPDAGVITISTIPVYPVYYNIVLILIAMGIGVVYKRRGKICISL